MNPPTLPFVIRFQDFRYVGGYHDLEYKTETELERAWSNLKRKNSKTNADLWINGRNVAKHYLKR